MLFNKLLPAALMAVGLMSSALATQTLSAVGTGLVALQKPTPGIFFSGEFDFELAPEVQDVLRRGISLHFVLEVEVEKKRWYWFDRLVSQARENIRLSYNPLTRIYRVSIGNMTQNFDTFEGALRLMQSVTNLFVGSYRDINSEEYEARARFYLDTSKLPKPFQVTLRKEDGWNLDTGWFPVQITDPER